MTGRRIRSVITGGMFVAVATLAAARTAMSLEVFRSYTRAAPAGRAKGPDRE